MIRKTIRKYIQHDELPSKKKVEKMPSKLNSYKSYVFQRIKEGTINCAVLYDEIVSTGYQVKRYSVRFRFIGK
ncbi:hypothetical protein ACRS52_11555 [Bacillus cytotoxicus]|uniref:Transposase n=1 Tax=Bacillus cytotoxicus TaxID=580165 RepID=A0AAX2CC75_9BACI|nr:MULTISPECIES: hypothetical protein [Bacillus cereus group]QTR71534.1 hypothetical protein JC775_02475 [Bacillus cytotoxicus]QTR83576.1 hypothetical protein JC777_03325 [Bacillus cytotoxicus]QTR87312.1 hypothetical protein JC774_01515 [Bacillus cytotoxicus]SCL83804.1 Protein of unknown function [Bacillus cytotoxicus]HDR4572092.1 hypothetical protein [Bacillus cytotoxicus]